jgi:hypothetical protein
VPRDPVEQVPLAERLLLNMKLLYTDIQYWVVGLTPEYYHLHHARLSWRLHDFGTAAKHFLAYFKYTDNPQVRAELGLCFGTIEKWPEALAQYQRAAMSWSDPAVKLAIAEVHLRMGNTDACLAQIKSVDEEFPTLSASLGNAKAELLREVQCGA